MEISTEGIEPVTLSEVLALDTWNQSRTTEQLQDFISMRHSKIENLTEEE